jgi:hypothetical protein
LRVTGRRSREALGPKQHAAIIERREVMCVGVGIDAADDKS